MIDSEVIKKWTEALRSGLYDQISGFLGRSHDRRCVLGVLCQLAVDQGVIDEPDTEELPAEGYVYNYAGSKINLPPPVARWAGLTNDPMIDYDGTMARLSELNDRGLAFPALADLIEDKFLAPAPAMERLC